MQLKEFRVILPLTVEEYQIAQLYSVAEASKKETGGGEGIEVVKNEPFTNHPLLGKNYASGQYTYKIYHLSSKVPAFIRLLVPKGSMEINEEAWNAYPYCRTIITNPKFMKDDFKIVIESMHVDDDIGTQENVHKLSAHKLKERQLAIINIATDPVSPADYKADEDPKLFKSVKTGRGPLLNENWMKNMKPVMTCYKLVSCHFKWFGLQARVEDFILKTEQRLFTNFHRQLFCWMDRWHNLTISDIRNMEAKVKAELDQQRLIGPVRGMVAVSD